MSIETYQFNLPITPGSIPPVLHLSQYDSGRTFTAILRDDANVPFELDSGATAVIKGRNAAGIAWQQDCTVSGANVTFTPSGAATDQFGVMPVTIEITESAEVISPLCVIFNIQKAGYTNEEAVLSPDFETAIQAAVAQAIAEGGLGFSDEFKEALLACFNGVAWATTGGQALIDDLEAALYPEVPLVSITAAYDQDHAIYNTDSLETVITTINYDLTVVANYSDGTSEPLSSSDYTITGTVEAGASVPFTVTYEGKTATINVLILDNTATPIYELQSAVSTNSYDTNVQLFDTPKSFTILCEADANIYGWNSAMNPAIFGLGTGNTFKAGYTQNIKKVDNGQVTGDYTYYYCGFACNYSGDSFTGKARSLYSKGDNAMSIRRIAVTYDHVTRKVSVFCANYTALHAPTAGWWILSGDITSETTIKLNIGTSSTCTTNKFNVYDTILSDAQINRFLDEGVA